ncbi:orotate phosphoribosyltransferase [bacterium CPR1]|nr:orotate phosphoribosyltransferase [bacterium CPR1]
MAYDPAMDGLPEFLKESGVLRLGEFRLKSGRLSPYFLNFGEVASGAHLAALGGFFARGVRQHFPRATLLYGPAYKGLPLALATCQALYHEHQVDLAYFSLRKEGKEHGEGGRVLGRPPGPHDHIVILDDVMTTSGTKREALDDLATLGGKVEGVLVGVDRQEGGASAAFEAETGVRVRSLLTVDDLFARLGLDPELLSRYRAGV